MKQRSRLVTELSVYRGDDRLRYVNAKNYRRRVARVGTLFRPYEAFLHMSPITTRRSPFCYIASMLGFLAYGHESIGVGRMFPLCFLFFVIFLRWLCVPFSRARIMGSVPVFLPIRGPKSSCNVPPPNH